MSSFKILILVVTVTTTLCQVVVPKKADAVLIGVAVATVGSFVIPEDDLEYVSVPFGLAGILLLAGTQFGTHLSYVGLVLDAKDPTAIRDLTAAVSSLNLVQRQMISEISDRKIKEGSYVLTNQKTTLGQSVVSFSLSEKEIQDVLVLGDQTEEEALKIHAALN